MDYSNLSIDKMLYWLLGSIRGAKAFHFVFYPVGFGDALDQKLDNLPVRTDDTPAYRGISIFRVYKEMKRTLVVVSLADALQGWEKITARVIELSGIHPTSFHDWQADEELAILIRIPKDAILTGFTPTSLKETAADLGEYALGITSLIEMEDGSARHLPILDWNIELPSDNHLLIRSGSSKDALDRVQFPATEYARLLDWTYTSPERPFIYLLEKVEQAVKILGLNRSAIVCSGQSLHTYGNEPMHPLDLLPNKLK